mmetsp:Transcript_12789/g.27726  ORF Transcript_12789/g.27726 Transcript_12789/m.27726 type:complete len:87 (+) Transcript_12789:1110-1370(+)
MVHYQMTVGLSSTMVRSGSTSWGKCAAMGAVDFACPGSGDLMLKKMKRMKTALQVWSSELLLRSHNSCILPWCGDCVPACAEVFFR